MISILRRGFFLRSSFGHVFVLCFGVLFLGGKGFAQAQALSYPDRVLFPWRGLHFSKAFRSLHAPSFAKAHQALRDVYLGEPKSLDVYVQKKVGPPLTFNLQKWAAKVLVGRSKEDLLGEAFSLEPLICSLGEHSLFVLPLVHTQNHELWASGHSLVPRVQLDKALAKGSFSSLLTLTVLTAYKRLVAATRLRPERAADALKLILVAGKSLRRVGKGSGRCLNVLLGARLVEKGYRVLMRSGLESMQSLSRSLGRGWQGQKATRQYLLNWSLPHSLVLEELMQADISFLGAEAVFASGTHSLQDATFSLSLSAENGVNISPPEELVEALEAEKRSLSFATLPRVQKTYGAWAYLDKGRAWGLKMSDRLVAENEEVFGHVVSFYGPEEGVKTSDGKIVSEGAIVYVRRGLRQLRKGLSFKLDPQTFPTPWPPAPSLP